MYHECQNTFCPLHPGSDLHAGFCGEYKEKFALIFIAVERKRMCGDTAGRDTEGRYCREILQRGILRGDTAGGRYCGER